MVRTVALWMTLLAGMVACLGACATGYHAMNVTGGYDDARMDSNTFRVEFRGNAYSSRSRVEIFLLYRCAEITVQNGFDYFIFLTGGTDAKQSSFTTPGRYTGSASGTGTTIGNTTYVQATATGTYVPGQTFNFTKYGAVAIVKAFRGEKPDHPGAFVAREVMSYLGPKVGAKPGATPRPVVSGPVAPPAPPPARGSSFPEVGAREGVQQRDASPSPTPGVDLQASPGPAPSAAAARGGRLRVLTSPAGADVYVGGLRAGVTTPDGLLIELPPGSIVVAVRKPGYLPIERNLRIEPDDEVVLPLTLQSQPEG